LRRLSQLHPNRQFPFVYQIVGKYKGVRPHQKIDEVKMGFGSICGGGFLFQSTGEARTEDAILSTLHKMENIRAHIQMQDGAANTAQITNARLIVEEVCWNCRTGKERWRHGVPWGGILLHTEDGGNTWFVCEKYHYQCYSSCNTDYKVHHALVNIGMMGSGGGSPYYGNTSGAALC
jgi:hypothetical protein